MKGMAENVVCDHVPGLGVPVLGSVVVHTAKLDDSPGPETQGLEHAADMLQLSGRSIDSLPVHKNSMLVGSTPVVA